MEEDVARSEEVENTRLRPVEEEEASCAPFKPWELDRTDGDAKGGGEGLADDDVRLIQTLGIEQKESRLIETVLDKNRSAR